VLVAGDLYAVLPSGYVRDTRVYLTHWGTCGQTEQILWNLRQRTETRRWPIEQLILGRDLCANLSVLPNVSRA
jgi:hypothetical protein